MKKALIIIILASFASCGTFNEVPGAIVQQDKSFRSLSTWDYSVEFEDGTKRSATVKVKVKKGVNPYDIAYDAVERLFKDRKDEIFFINVKPNSNMHGLVLNNNYKK